ncbi:MAG: methionyl-tRNA formyltransferase [Bacteroidales bacterium]|nr:methionyl-tRNA formyltransferase [Bacteroidales bacterium]
MFRKLKIKFKEIFHRTSIVYMGTPEFAVAPLETLLDAGYRISAVVTVPDKPSGRGQSVNESAVKKFAVSKGIPVLQPEKLKDPSFLEALKSYKPDLFVVVAFRMLPREVWSIPRLGTFNLHAALLPQYRGAAPINWAVINGEKATGVTSFLIDAGVDTGTILMREQYKIGAGDTASDVHDALMELGSRVVLQTVEGLIAGNIDSRVQKSFIQGEEILHKAPKLSRELCHIDWDDTALHIVNLVRGLSDYPCAFTELVGTDGSCTALKIFKAHVAEGGEGGSVCQSGDEGRNFDGGSVRRPGTIISDGKTFLGIASRDAVVALDEIQLAGKKRMSVADFLRGFHDPCSYKVSAGTSREVIDAVHDSEVTE